MLSEQELIAYLENTLPSAERARVELELERNPHERREALGQVRLDAALRASLGTTSANERVKQSILAVVRGESEAALKQKVLADAQLQPATTNSKPLLIWREIFATIRKGISGGFEFARHHRWATACVGLFVLGFAAWLLIPGAARDIELPVLVQLQNTTVQAKAGEMIRAGNARSATVKFADGTTLHLEPGTEVALKSVANPPRAGGKQLELITGSLSASVAKQPAGLPMLIQTPHALVTVVGTEFDLNVATNQTELAVTHGLVKMSAPDTTQPVSVAAGEFAVAAPRGPLRYGKLARHPFLWPFSSTSIWNRPLGDGARFTPVPGKPILADGPLVDVLRPRRPFIGSPGDPLRRVWVNGAVRADVRLADDALPGANISDSWVLLQHGRRFALELRGVTVRADGDLDAQAIARTDLAGPGVDDSASDAKPFGFSNLGGLLRVGELENGIRHALACRVSRQRLGGRNDFQTPSTLWPATGGDAASGEFLNIGTLLAIPPDVDVAARFSTNSLAYALARAMQDYGVYVTGVAPAPFTLLTDDARIPNADEWLNQLVPLLQVVTNNAQAVFGKPRHESAPALPGEAN